jgi:hypothetical protein
VDAAADPLHETFTYVLREGLASGKDLLVAVNLVDGGVVTVRRGSDLVASRLIPIK